MLSKLIKHEFKATARYLIPLYLILIAITIINRIVLRFDFFEGAFQFIPGILIFSYVLIIIVIGIVTFLIMIMRFYKNLVTDEGYLMFTLPVKVKQIITSKLLVTVCWIILSLISILTSLYVVFITPEHKETLTSSLTAAYQELNDVFGGYTAIMITQFALLFIFTMISVVLLIYASISIGQLFQGHKLIGSFGAYIGLYTLVQIILALLVFIAYLIKPEMNDINVLKFIFPFILFLQIMFSITFFSTTSYIFKNKLNLE